jgi:hypothetical protein
MPFYADMAAMARGLLSPDAQGGLGQGELALVRTETIPAANSWDEPTEAVTRETLRGAVSGVAFRFVDGTTILASDLQAICEVPAMDYRPGDTFEIDGAPATILQVRNIPEAGTRAAIRFILRR